MDGHALPEVEAFVRQHRARVVAPEATVAHADEGLPPVVALQACGDGALL